MFSIDAITKDKNKVIYNRRKIKLTDHKKRWVLKHVRKFSEQVGIAYNDIPSVVFTRKEVLALPREVTVGARTVTHKCLGVCF